MALVFGSYALYWHYAAKVPTSPIVLYASHDSGVGGTTLIFRADGTFRYENAAFIASDVVTGHYTRTDGLPTVAYVPVLVDSKEKRARPKAPFLKQLPEALASSAELPPQHQASLRNSSTNQSLRNSKSR